MAGDPVDDSLLMSLVEKEIPDGRNALLESHNNLADLAAYCKENYINSEDKTKALQETKEFASQSLASVAYQIHSLAVNILQMMDQQTIQLQKMQSNANNIGLLVDIHKEKVSRREIGSLTSSKNFSRAHKVVPPTQPEKVKKYKREDIDYSQLDNIGHGVKTERKDDATSERRSSKSSSSGSLKESSVHSSPQSSLHGLPGSIYKPNSIDRTGGFGGTMPPPHRPPVAPVAPFKVKAAPAPTAPPVAPTPQVELPPPSTPVLANPPPLEENAYEVVPPPPTNLPEPDDNDMETKNLPPPPPPPPEAEDLYDVPTKKLSAIEVDDLPPMPVTNVDDLPPPPPVNPYEVETDTENIYQAPPPHAMPPPPPIELPEGGHVIPEKYEEKVVAIYDYQKLRDDELELMEGDVIYVIKKNEDGWFEGIKDGVQGLFPGNYVTPYM